MSTELKSVKGRNCNVMLTQFGASDGSFQPAQRCLQLNSSNFQDKYVQLTVEQARDLAAALLEFADGTREDFMGYPCGISPVVSLEENKVNV
jgi:hypothetical protein